MFLVSVSIRAFLFYSVLHFIGIFSYLLIATNWSVLSFQCVPFRYCFSCRVHAQSNKLSSYHTHSEMLQCFFYCSCILKVNMYQLTFFFHLGMCWKPPGFLDFFYFLFLHSFKYNGREIQEDPFLDIHPKKLSALLTLCRCFRFGPFQTCFIGIVKYVIVSHIINNIYQNLLFRIQMLPSGKEHLNLYTP